MAIQPGDRIIYMKVGTHAKENLSDIIARKRAEIEAEGFALWGYGGSTCTPARVQPFAGAVQGPIMLVMQEMDSRHFAEPVRAEEFSVNGIDWQPVPDGINCNGSRFALFIDSLDQVDDHLDLGRTRVAVGAKQGRAGTDYIKGRVDKACLEVTDELVGESKLLDINLLASLRAPWAVLLRN